MNDATDSDGNTVAADHSGLAAKRLIVGVTAGVGVAAVALAAGASWSVAALGASDVAALVFVIWVWLTVAGAEAESTARIARAEDASRAASESVLVGAGGASLLVVGFTLAQGHAHAPSRGLLTALALGSVALAWTSVHTASLRAPLLQPARRRNRFSAATPPTTWTSHTWADDRDDLSGL